MSAYGYIDTGDSYALCRMVDKRACYVFATQTGLSIRKHPPMPVPAPFVALRRAPTLIWKSHIDQDVRNGHTIEMVDLNGAPATPAPPTPADQAFIVFAGSGIIVATLGVVAAWTAASPRHDRRE